MCVFACLLLGGCSWFSSRPSDIEAGDAPATSSDAAAIATAPAEPEPAPVPTQGPESVATDFLTMHQRLGNSGLPAVDAMNAYGAFLCPALATSLRDAKIRQEQFRASRPDEKPPLVEGDLFSSLFEGPEAWTVAETRVDGDRAEVVLDLRHGEGAAATRWKDRMQMQLDDGIWCIADVEYQGQWPAANRGRLSESLAR